MEEGFVTLAKIIGTLVGAMSLVPLLFLFTGGGDRSEPSETYDER